jgi:hypothetical protein
VAFAVLAAEAVTDSLDMPTGEWLDLIPPMTVVATGGAVLFQGTLAPQNFTMYTRVLLDGAGIETWVPGEGQLTTILNVAAGSHTVNFQGNSGGSMMNHDDSTLTSPRGFAVVSLV